MSSVSKPGVLSQEEGLAEALEAARDRKAQDIVLLDLQEVTTFTDHFLICSGISSRHVQGIADEIERRLRVGGLRPAHIEGYNHAEWVLMDYADFVVHIFGEKARGFYDLERLWRTAGRRTVSSE